MKSFIKHIIDSTVANLVHLFFLLSAMNSFSQSLWGQTNSPIMSRYEDVFFLNKDTGFAVSGAGYIYKTENGGINWTQKYLKQSQYIRSIEFSTPQRGFAGSLLSTYGITFMKTLDGGNTWTDISNVLTFVNGVCGICCVDSNVTYAVGAWSTPAFVLKTLDGGLTWTQINMNSYASGLVDVQFIDQNTGYVSGSSNIPSEGAVILKTTDGGQTWNKVYVSNQAGDYIWKIQNLNGTNWFGSIQRGALNSATKIVRSDDGGNTWTEKTVAITIHRSQMVGFINPNKGWAGENDLYESNDGGNTWIKYVALPNNYNRFFRISESIAYLSGVYVYKLGGIPTSIQENVEQMEEFLDIKIFPNPQPNPIEIKLISSQKTAFAINIFDVSGKQSVYHKGGVLEMGMNKITIETTLPKGLYYLSVMVNAGVKDEKFIVE